MKTGFVEWRSLSTGPMSVVPHVYTKIFLVSRRRCNTNVDLSALVPARRAFSGLELIVSRYAFIVTKRFLESLYLTICNCLVVWCV